MKWATQNPFGVGARVNAGNGFSRSPFRQPAFPCFLPAFAAPVIRSFVSAIGLSLVATALLPVRGRPASEAPSESAAGPGLPDSVLVSPDATARRFEATQDPAQDATGETVLATARGVAVSDTSYSGFARRLAEQRSRNGTMRGYCSRLHYFTEWPADNEDRGLLRASLSNGVVVSPDLQGYVQTVDRQIGIVVARPRPGP